MHDMWAQLLGLLRGTWNHRWTAMAIAWPVLIAGLAAVYLVPNKYEASARIYVDTQSVLRPLMSGMTVLPNLDQQVTLMTRTLLARPNLEKLLRMSDLDLRARRPEDREKLLEQLQKDITLGAAGNNLYTITFRAEDRGLTQRVVQSLMTIFVEGSLGDNRKDSESARKFIQEQIKGYEEKLVNAENRVKDFRLKYMGSLPGSGTDYFGRMQEVGNRLTQAKMDLREAEDGREAIKKQLTEEEPALIDIDSPALAEQPGSPNANPIRANPVLEARIESLRKEVDTLLLKYTNEHPDVVAGRRLLGQLEAQRDEEIALLRVRAEEAKRAAEAAAAKAKASGGRNTRSNNPVFQQLRVSLAESEATVASMRARVNTLEADLAALRAKAASVPAIEAEFAQLNRDYEVHRQNYQNLLARRESATLSGEMENQSKLVDFRIVDPPRVSPTPVWPNRPLLVSLVFVAALAAGIGLAFVVSQVRPIVLETKTLREIANRPLLGSVSMIWNNEQRRRARLGMLTFAVSCFAMVGLYGTGLAYFLLNSRVL